MDRLTDVAAAAVLTLIAAHTASAALVGYSIVDLGPTGAAIAADAHAVNANGEVVGEYDTTTGSQGFSYLAGTRQLFGTGTTALRSVNSSGIAVGFSGNNGVMLNTFSPGVTPTSIGTFGGPTVANGINNLGEIVGSSQYPTTTGYAFYTTAGTGTLTPLTPAANQSASSTAIGGAGSVAMAVNDAGTIVGQASKGSAFHSFLYTGGTVYDMGTLSTNPGATSEATAINTGGDVVGYSDGGSTGDVTAYLYDNYHVAGGAITGTYVDLSSLGGDSMALGINDSDMIVGTSEDVSGDDLAFLYQTNTGMVDLNTLIGPGSGWTLESAESINDGGQIVGYGLLDGVQHAFLLQPAAVPEPAAMLMVPVAIAALIGRRKKRRD
jgi:probable HAF family extracellular repeat protein